MEINQDLAFSRAEWRIQRVGWVLMLAVGVAAVFGLFGTGILSESVADGNGIAVRYPRFTRMSSPAEITVTVHPAAVQGELVRIWFSREYARRLEIDGAAPPPEFGFTAGDRIGYAFRSTPNQAAVVTFRLRLKEGSLGPIRARVGVLPGAETDFWQFVWP